MALTAAEIEIKIALLETALAKGESRVDFADRSVTYKTVEELLQAIEYFRGLLAAANGHIKQSVGVGTSGFA